MSAMSAADIAVMMLTRPFARRRIAAVRGVFQGGGDREGQRPILRDLQDLHCQPHVAVPPAGRLSFSFSLNPKPELKTLIGTPEIVSVGGWRLSGVDKPINPETKPQTLNTPNPKPETRDLPENETGNPTTKPETLNTTRKRNPKPENGTRNPKLKTRSPQPGQRPGDPGGIARGPPLIPGSEPRNLKPEIRSPEPEIRNSKPQTPNPKP